jgi:2TM domain
VCALIAANWMTGGNWWSFWPLAAWGVVLAAHYMVYKSSTVDEAWANERTAELHSKSYDASHIDRIAADHGGRTADREKK